MDWEKKYGRVVVLAAFLFGLAARVLAGKDSIVGGGVLFDGYDSFYHMRRIMYCIEHFPGTLWQDSYLNYPHGLELTWPPLFDQLIALVALLLGARSEGGAEMVGALIPPILGSLTIVVIYLLVRRLFDDKTALLAAILTAIAPYSFQKSVLGAMDHHSMETLLFVGTITLLAYALGDRPRYAFAALGGVAMAAMAYTWMGSAAYFGVVLIYGLAQMTLDLKRKNSSRDLTAVLLTAFCVALLLLAPYWSRPWLQPSFLSLLAIALALVVLYLITTALLGRGVPWAAFPVIVLALGYCFVILSHFLSSSVGTFAAVDQLVRQGIEYLFSGGMIGKIAEAEPIWVNVSFVTYFGINFFLALAGLAALIYRLATRGWTRPQVLFLVWTLAVLAMTVGQKRFLYLYSINMAVLISILFFEALDLARQREILDTKLYKTASVLLLAILVFPSAAETLSIAGDMPAITGDWYESLEWLEENTPATGHFDEPFEKAEYSVLTWWDYGNWVLYESRRPVVANNFQAGVMDSARFYLSESEDAATAILDRRGSRYVITDFDMLYGKLDAMTSWVGEDTSSYMATEERGRYVNVRPLQRLMSTTMAGLHLLDGNRMGHFRLIYESKSSVGSNPPTHRIKIFQYVPGALITGTTKPDEPVGVVLNVTSNQGRNFQYFNFAPPENGRYEIRVPYSTKTDYDTHAIGKYSVFSGGRNLEIEVTEEDVLEGRVIEVNF